MTCEQARPLIEPYLDGELNASQKAEVERHLAGCSGCAAAESRLRRLQSELRTLARRYDASELLLARVRNGLRAESAATTVTTVRARVYEVNAWAIAATVLLAVSLGWNVVQLRSRADITQEIVSSHVRSLIGNHLLDVQSTDQHNVKPWFNGKLDYAPDVKDFATDGFPLVGGRVDYIDHRAIAALVYKRREHVINLFVWPSGTPLTSPSGVNGFNLVTWDRAGMDYCAISDLNETELRQFASLYR